MSTKQEARRTCWRLNEEKWEQLGWSSEEVVGEERRVKERERERDWWWGREKKKKRTRAVRVFVCA